LLVLSDHPRVECAVENALLVTPGGTTIRCILLVARVAVEVEFERLTLPYVNEKLRRAWPSDGEWHGERSRLLALNLLCQGLCAIKRCFHPAGLHTDCVVNGYSHIF